MEYRDEIGRPSVEETALGLHNAIGFCRDVAEAQNTLEMMISAGHKYKQLENHLGAGVCFVLGTELGETWSATFQILCWPTALINVVGPRS